MRFEETGGDKDRRLEGSTQGQPDNNDEGGARAGVSCSFCGKHQREVKKIIAGPTVYICDECIGLCNDIIGEAAEDAAKDHGEAAAESKDEGELAERRVPNGVPLPRQIYDELSKHVMGQEKAKKVISVAIFSHLTHLQMSGGKCSKGYRKPNVLLVGPSGTGKTLLVQSLANYLNIPLAISDATTLTEAGYVGEDVENVLHRLLKAADDDIAKAERGIVFIDEIDKIAKKSTGQSVTRDVSGEGVQQALLKMLEGSVCQVPREPRRRKHPEAEYVDIDTSGILFLCGGAFTEIKELLGRDVNRGRQDADEVTTDVDLGSRVTPDHFLKYGFIPEFIGRFPQVAFFHALNEDDLVRILNGVENSIISQYKKLFAESGVELVVEVSALPAIARKAIKLGYGARGLQNVLHGILFESLFGLPESSAVQKCVVDAGTVDHGRSPRLVGRDGDVVFEHGGGISLVYCARDAYWGRRLHEVIADSFHEQPMTFIIDMNGGAWDASEDALGRLWMMSRVSLVLVSSAWADAAAGRGPRMLQLMKLAERRGSRLRTVPLGACSLDEGFLSMAPPCADVLRPISQMLPSAQRVALRRIAEEAVALRILDKAKFTKGRVVV